MSRQIAEVFAVALDGFGQRGVADPKRYVVLTSRAREHDRERGDPASAPENGDPAHAASLFLPKENFGSSPCTSRWMLPSCLQMMIPAAASAPKVTIGGGACCGAQRI